MKTIRHCEPLESRQLLSGGFTTTNTPTTIVSIPSVRAAATATPIGSAGNVLIAYIKNSTLFATIIDPSSNTVVPEFPINTEAGFTPNGQIPMASTTDSSGNAVIVFPVGTQFTSLEITRISPTGSILSAPALIGGTFSQSTPGLAAGPNGQIAVAWVRNRAGVYTNVFDSSDNPLFTETPLSDAAPQGVSSENFTNLSVIYNPTASRFLAAWDVQDLDNSGHNLRQSIIDRSFTSTGVVGADPTVDTSATDTLGAPCQFVDPTTSTCEMAFSDCTAPANGQITTRILMCTEDADGNPTFATVPLFSGTSSTEEICDQAFPTGTGFTFICTHGTPDPSGFIGVGIDAFTCSHQGQLLATNTNVLPFNFVYTPAIVTTTPGDFLGISFAFTTSPPGTTITTYPGIYVAPSTSTGGTTGGNTGGGTTMTTGISVALTAATVTRSEDGAAAPDMVVTATVDNPSAHEINIHIDNLNPSSFINASQFGPEGNVSLTITIPANQRSASVSLPISGYRAGESLSENVNLNAEVGPGTVDTINIIDPMFFGVVTTIPGTAAVKGTATPGKPFTATDPDGTQELISITVGQCNVSTLPDGNLKLSLSKTTAKSFISIAPSSKSQTAHPNAVTSTADARFDVEQIVSSSPIGTFSAPTTDINGSISLKGVSSLTIGNAANHITLGPVTSAVVRFANLTDAIITATGSIKTFSTTDWLGGSLSATSIITLTDAGDFDANLTATSLSTLSISGALGGTSATDVRSLRATQSIGAISAASVANALIFAGVKPTIKTLPKTRAVFTSLKASITSFSLKGASPAFSNTIIAAPTIGTASLAGLVSTNATPFGVAAEKITTYKHPPITKKNPTKKGAFDSVGQFSAAII